MIEDREGRSLLQGGLLDPERVSGRSGRLARLWATSTGLPDSFARALFHDPTWTEARLQRVVVDHVAAAPGPEGVVRTDLMVEVALGARRGVIAVEGRIDTSIWSPPEGWASSSIRSPLDERFAARRLCERLGLREASRAWLPAMRRLWAALEAAEHLGAPVAMAAVHRVSPEAEERPVGWSGFSGLARALAPGRPGPVQGRPWRVGPVGEIEAWMLWVPEVVGVVPVPG